MGLDTISVEHVRDVADGYVGEIIGAKGIPWIRYRVWLGPKETVTRIDIDMTSMVGASRGNVPMPLLSARLGRDSIVISPADGMAGMVTFRERVPSSALLVIGASIASDEQAIRRARELGNGEVSLPLVESMNGQIWNATITPLRGELVRVRIVTEEWQFTCDRRGHIQRGRDSGGLEIKRIDPGLPLPVNQTISIPDSTRQVELDSRRSRFEHQTSLEGEFQSVLGNDWSPERISSAVDPLIAEMGERGGAFQAQLCVAAASCLRQRKGGLAAAERYAHRAVAYADAHDVLSYGDNGLLAARTASRKALGEIQFALGQTDSAFLMVRSAIEMLPEFEELALQSDLRVSLGGFFAARGRDEEAIATLFESVALDPNENSVAAVPALRRVWKRRFGDDADLDGRIKLAQGRKWASAMGGGLRTPTPRQAPSWSLRDLAGGIKQSTAFVGRPMVLVFWGGWTGANRAILRSAEHWYRHSISLGVDVVSMNWELPGLGPISAGLARQLIARNHYTLPVLLDHDQAVFKRFGGEAYPQVFFIDGSGLVNRTVFGGAAASYDSLDAWVGALGDASRR
jgi:tetratricopeptide (TPR) repeat protein